MLRNIFRRQINSITVAAALVALSSLASRFLGIIRDRILAGQFGAGTTLDIYYAAFRVPDLIFNLLVLGALSAGFIPIFTSLIKDWRGGTDSSANQGGNGEAWALANNILNLLLLGLVVISAAGMVWAGGLTRLITPGFGPDEQESVTALTRVMFLSPIFLGISGILGGILQSFKRFLIYSLAPIFYNLGIIIGALYFVKLWGVYGLAWGVILGAFLHMAIQVPSVYHLGFRYHFHIAWRDGNTKKIGKMMVPRTLSLAIAQINLLVITVIASKLSSGSLTVFNFANNLQSFPIGIFGISFAIAAFPALSEAAFDREKLGERFSETTRQILFFIIPATVLMIALRAQLIRVILGTGHFDWQDTILTMNTLGFFVISLFAQALLPLLVRVFYARHNSATPFYLGLVTVVINIILSFWLGAEWGVVGLALAYSLANILNLVLLWIGLYVKVGTLGFGQIIVASLKFIIAALAAGLAAQLMKLPVAALADMTRFSGVFFQLVVSAGAGLLVYGLFCYLLGSEELFGFLSALKNRWPFKKVRIDDQGEARGV